MRTAPATCGNCHRVLRDPASKARGYGPKCWADRHRRRGRRGTTPRARTPRAAQIDGQLELTEGDVDG